MSQSHDAVAQSRLTRFSSTLSRGAFLLALASCSNQSGGTLGNGADNGGSSNNGGSSEPVFGTSGSSTGGSSSGSNGTNAGSGGDGPSDPMTPAACSVIEGLPGGLECGSQAGTATIRKPNMLIVLDKSGSQITEMASFEGVLNWDALLQALDSALTDVQDQMAMGLKLYPDDGIIFDCNQNECCRVSQAVQVPVGPGTESVPEILSLLNDTEPAGGTPTAAGLRAALHYYTEGEGADLEGQKYVLLATDGGPNCNTEGSCTDAPERCTINLEGRCNTPGANCCEMQPLACVDDDETVGTITALREAGIDTYVVGIPGSEAYADFLDAFAEAGGRTNPNGPEKYYAVSAAGGVEALTMVFEEITTQLIQTCDFQLDQTPPDPEKVNVALDCTAIAPGSTSTDGGVEVELEGAWRLDEDTDPPTIRLLGDTCAQVQTTGVERIDFIFGCPTIR